MEASPAPAAAAAAAAAEPPALVPGEISMAPPRTVVRRPHTAAGHDDAAALAKGTGAVLRRYFFATPATQRLGSLHFDVLLDPADKIDHSTDHLRYRYVDFLTLPGAEGVLDKATNSADIEDIRKWLDHVRPRSRIEAYPQFVVCKELLHHLLQGGVTFTNRLGDQLRLEVEAAETQMESLRDAYASGEAVLEAEIAKLAERIAALTEELAAVKEQCTAELAELNAQLQEARAHLAEAEAAKAELEAKVTAAAEELMQAEKKIASALGDCYQPEMMAEQLRKMMADRTLSGVLDMLETDDKMQLFRQLMHTFDIGEKHDAMKEVFGHFIAGELDLGVVTANMRDPEKDDMLQMLLKEFKHNPQAVLKQLGGGADANLSDEERAKLEGTATGIVKQALEKGPEETQHALLDALEIDKMTLVKALLEEMGLAKFLETMGIDAAAVIANLGLVDPETNHPPQPIVLPTAPHSTQTDAADYAGNAAGGAVKRRLLSKALHMFDNVPEVGENAPKAKDSKATLRLISQIYEQKVKADEVDDKKAHTRERMPEFIFDLLLNQYGMKALATQHLNELVASVRKYSKEGTAEYNERIHLFGQLTGMLNTSAFNTVTVNFMMDFLKRLFVTDMIDESLNIPNCAITLEQATEAIQDAWIEYSTDLPTGIIDAVSKFGSEGKVALEGGGSEMLVQVPLDKVWQVVYTHWLSCVEEQDKRLLHVFNTFDEDHDGSLSLNEFKKMVNAVDFGTTGELPPDMVPIRKPKEVVRMYTQAVEESKGEAELDDQIKPGGFLTVAYQYNLGVGIRPEIRDDLVDDAKEKAELKDTQALGYTKDGILRVSSKVEG
jgi:hypothetical protein